MVLGKVKNLAAFCLLAGVPSYLGAQTPEDRALLQTLSHQVNDLQAKIKQLEAKLENAATRVSAPEAKVSQAPTLSPEPTIIAAKAESPSAPTLSFHGYGDLGFERQGLGDGRTSSFALGQVDLFVTSRIGDHFGLLMETVLENKESNGLSVDLERFIFQYRQNQYFNVDIGRYHSAIGYYNTAFHHGKWFQTAATRPRLFNFEDDGGVLPMHNVGVSFYGAVPSPKLNLGYTVEIGNGRDYRTESVQTVKDNTRGKSINLALHSRPSKISGLELGASLYRDRLNLNHVPIAQQILAAYGAYNRGRLEAITEFVGVKHTQTTPGIAKISTYLPGLYTQWSYRVSGAWRPYFRYEWANSSPRDPISRGLVDGGVLRSSYVGGIRYDLSEFAAVKFESQRVLRRNQPGETTAEVNFSFTF